MSNIESHLIDRLFKLNSLAFSIAIMIADFSAWRSNPITRVQEKKPSTFFEVRSPSHPKIPGAPLAEPFVLTLIQPKGG